MKNPKMELEERRSEQGKKKSVPTSTAPTLPVLNIFLFFLLPHVFAAFQSPIPDCDEVFNFYEASHYINHGYGLQTWEYSPNYAIRSWTYATVHAVVVFPMTIVAPYIGGKPAEFYFLRIVLGFVSTLCEMKLFYTISQTLNYRIALFFMLIITTSTGMFHASVSYLPSSFAMYTTMLGVSAFMDWTEGRKTATGIMWFAIGALIGWPFAAALIFPFMALEVFSAITSSTSNIISFLGRTTDGGIRSLAILCYQFWFDSIFYDKWTCVPLNIVLYNVFGESSKGPDIFGTEPWHFYIRNLLLNFGIWFPLALMALPLVLLQKLIGSSQVSRSSFLQNLTYISLVYIWLGIFTIQPHKEERFMFPIYPLIGLNAAFSIHVLLQFAGNTILRRIPSSIKLTVITGFMLAGIIFSALRTMSLTTGYTAPLRIYEPLNDITYPGDTVCLGKEWYRFPSSYFLPEGVSAKFIKSGFNGLLPGEFYAGNEFGAWAGTRLIPDGMNDENKEDTRKYINIRNCDFLVDAYFESSPPSDMEPNYAADSVTWKKVRCEPFLDAAATGILGRLFWLPDFDFLPLFLRRKWGDYCLLQRQVGSWED